MIEFIEIICFVALSAWIDAEHLKDNDYIESHLSRWLLRLLFILAASNFDIQKIIGMSLYFAATFDSALNMMRNKPAWTLGTTAKWDLFWRKHKIAYVILVSLSIPISIFILLYKF